MAVAWSVSRVLALLESEHKGRVISVAGCFIAYVVDRLDNDVKETNDAQGVGRFFRGGLLEKMSIRNDIQLHFSKVPFRCFDWVAQEWLGSRKNASKQLWCTILFLTPVSTERRCN